jgi:hypothetical protein
MATYCVCSHQLNNNRLSGLNGTLSFPNSDNHFAWFHYDAVRYSRVMAYKACPASVFFAKQMKALTFELQGLLATRFNKLNVNSLNPNFRDLILFISNMNSKGILKHSINKAY